MPSRHLTAIPKYVFWELDARRAALRATGRTLIDVGIGSPDLPIAPEIVEAMQRAAAESALSGYPHFRAHPAFTVAVAADRKSTRLNSSHPRLSRMPSSA